MPAARPQSAVPHYPMTRSSLSPTLPQMSTRWKERRRSSTRLRRRRWRTATTARWGTPPNWICFKPDLPRMTSIISFCSRHGIPTFLLKIQFLVYQMEANWQKWTKNNQLLPQKTETGLFGTELPFCFVYSWSVFCQIIGGLLCFKSFKWNIRSSNVKKSHVCLVYLNIFRK